jgi:undecaprenyl-diphosphatase
VSQKNFSKNEKTLALIGAIFLVSFLLIPFFRTTCHPFDVSVNVWAASIQSSPFILGAKGIAVLFDTPGLVLFSLVIATFLFIKNYRPHSIFLLIAMGVDALIVSIMKTLIQSPRPLNEIAFAYRFSYPSGHTAGIIVFSGMLAFFAWHRSKAAVAHVLIGAGAVAVSGVVGFSRIYLNVHWFSDVLGGAMLGVFWLSLAVLTFKLLKDAGRFEGERFRFVSLPLFVVAFVVAVLVAVNSLVV